MLEKTAKYGIIPKNYIESYYQRINNNLSVFLSFFMFFPF
jgi:hypothetical protein